MSRNSRRGMALAAVLMTVISTTAQSAPGGGASVEQDPGARQPYIIGFAEPALADYQGERPGLPAPRRKGEGRGRIDVASREARDYVADLALRQHDHEARASRALGRSLQVKRRMRHAFNGMVAELSDVEAQALARLPEVTLVESYREYELDTDAGPRLIGAEQVWRQGHGLPPGQVVGNALRKAGAQGEGVVFGILDSGINFGSPSFSAVARDGYRHVNPLGAGNYLGTCAPGGADEGRCNDKLIGGYDFVCGAPGNTCNTADIREEPGFGDTNSHGSHVAGTVAGNPRTAIFRGAPVEISGVAPRGNLIAYDVCYTRISTGQGLCPNVSSVAAIDQAMADGVDVINFSIGGGVNPWSEAVSQAFLAASNAGIFVAASAGNSGPGANTLGHVEPWVTTVAASQHGRAGFEFLLQVTGPGTPPDTLERVVLTPGTNGVAFAASLPGTTPLRVSSSIDSGADGCAAYPAGAFAGAIAVLRRGTCSFSIKANNASAAGAIAVVIANNAAGGLTPSVPGTSVPVFGAAQEAGNALRDFVAGGSATAAIPYPATAIANTPDQLGAFSSRGPANYDLIKPDVAAPGVAVLAASAGATIGGFEDLVDLKSGTSMASPHVAGAAGLLRQLYPSWTPAEIKSALMLTAKPEMLKEDGQTPADPLARGAGRIQVERAARAALVMDETTGNYQAANPATGGQVNRLNLPSLNDRACVANCTFTRTLRSTRRPATAWTARLEGVDGSVQPATFTLKGGQTATLTIRVDSRSLPADGRWNFGRLVLEPQSDSPHVASLQMPVAISVPAPRLQASPGNGVALTLPAGRSGEIELDIGNAGGGVLDWSIDNSQPVSAPIHVASNDGVGSGTRSTFFTDQGTGTYAADDFVVEEDTVLNFLSANGFTTNSSQILATARSVTWAVYPDAGGVPAGDPQTSRDRALWSYTSAPNGPGLGASNNWLHFDPEQAGQQVSLAPGRYWMVVHAETTFANRWAWYQSNLASGHPARVISPAVSTAWSEAAAGLAFEVDGWVRCGASWLASALPAAGSVVGGNAAQTLKLRIDSAGLAPGDYRGRLCVASNDPVLSRYGIPVRLTVTAP